MKTAPRRESGIALVVTLLVLVLVTALAWEIFRLGARGAQTGAYGRDSIRAALAAEGGAAVARVVLREDARKGTRDTLDEPWALPAPPFEFEEGTIRISLEDEDRKINVNRIIGQNGNAPDDRVLAVFRRLLENLGIDPSLSDAILDWLDNGDAPRVGGAESAYYLALPDPYRAKNDFFDTVEELRLVRGITPEIFEKLRPYVTVLPWEYGKVNINTAPKPVLMALSAGPDIEDHGTIDDALADEIIARRQVKPFDNVAGLKDVSPVLDELSRRPRFTEILDVRSTAFRVLSTGEVAGTVRTVQAVGTRSGNEIKWRYWRLE